MSAATPPATIRCTKCGAAFACEPAGECWCKDETIRLPLPADGTASCLCPKCLRAMAEAQQQQ